MISDISSAAVAISSTHGKAEKVKLFFKECGLELHPNKTKIVYCKDGSRRKDYPNQSFDFLGYTLQSRLCKNTKHNYGHGYKNLCSVMTMTMTMLMMLTFLIDQVQQLCCKIYQKARKHVGTLRRLFEKIQNRIDIAVWDNWHDLLTYAMHVLFSEKSCIALTFIGDPASRPPPLERGYIIA